MKKVLCTIRIADTDIVIGKDVIEIMADKSDPQYAFDVFQKVWQLVGDKIDIDIEEINEEV